MWARFTHIHTSLAFYKIALKFVLRFIHILQRLRTMCCSRFFQCSFFSAHFSLFWLSSGLLFSLLLTLFVYLSSNSTNRNNKRRMQNTLEAKQHAMVWNVNANKATAVSSSSSTNSKNMIKLKWCMRHDFNPNFVKCNETKQNKKQQQQQRWRRWRRMASTHNMHRKKASNNKHRDLEYISLVHISL